MECLYADGRLQEREKIAARGRQRTVRTEPGPPSDEEKAAGCAGAGARVWQEEA